jgi:endonuclease/exonuclease/phosphatase family metal-dependent hydrolase
MSKLNLSSSPTSVLSLLEEVIANDTSNAVRSNCDSEVPPAASTAEEETPTMKLMVYNVGLLRLRLFYKLQVFANPPFADERFAHIPKALLSSGADIIALQEIYEDCHVNSLISQVKHIYPFYARGHERDNGKWQHPSQSNDQKQKPSMATSFSEWKFHNGLLLLSKYPIESAALIKHKRAALLEQIMGSKSMLAARVRSPLGMLFLLNVHATAGGERDPEDTNVDIIRQHEMEEVVSVCNEELQKNPSSKAIILGDLNAGPYSSVTNFNYVVENGFEDMLEGYDATTHHTWHPENPLNKVGPHANGPIQRIDHILTHRSTDFESVDASILYREPCVETGMGLSTISDHYAVLCTLRAKQKQFTSKLATPQLSRFMFPSKSSQRLHLGLPKSNPSNISMTA